MAADAVSIGPLTLLPGRELLGEDGIPIAIGGRAFQILEVLAARGGDLVLKDELLDAVWPGLIVEENALQAQISALRRALGPEAERVITIHGRGYRLRIDSSGRQAAASGQAPPGSVAVLAFLNLTGDPALTYLADGLAEELIGRLSRIPGLKVPARTSSFTYRTASVDVPTIARQLGVATVLEGSIRGDSAHLRVNVQLIDAATGFQRWSASLDDLLENLLGLQEALAQAIAAALRRELAPRSSQPGDPEALRLVLQARAMSRVQTRESLLAAERAASTALTLSPDYAKAWEALAGTRWVMISMGFADRSSLEDVRQCARRALELDPHLGGAEAILAVIDAASGRLLEAMRRFDTAFALDPENPLIPESRALLTLLPAGCVRAAFACANASEALGAARPQPCVVHALCGLLAGDMALAASRVETALLLGHQRTPLLEFASVEIALAQKQAGQLAASLKPLIGNALGLTEPGLLEIAEALCSGTGQAMAGSYLLAAFEMADVDALQSVTLGTVIRCLAGLNLQGEALAACRMIGERWRHTGLLPTTAMISFWLPGLAALRADARFTRLTTELGLPAFWARFGPADALLPSSPA